MGQIEGAIPVSPFHTEEGTDKMPEKKTLAAARRDKRQGKSASTQAGEFVREEFHHARSGKHPVKSKKQAVAIGLSKARRAGVRIKRNPKKSSKSHGSTRSRRSR